jgi:hypothetical protein
MLLVDHAAAVLAIAARLVRYRSLTGEQIDRIIRNANKKPPEGGSQIQTR